jgi:hypothetical protein
MTFNQKLYVCSRKLFCILLTILLRIGIPHIEIDHIFRVTSLVLRYNYFNFVFNCLMLVKTHLQNGENCAKLVGFKENKNIFACLKLLSHCNFQHSVNTASVWVFAKQTLLQTSFHNYKSNNAYNKTEQWPFLQLFIFLCNIRMDPVS